MPSLAELQQRIETVRGKERGVIWLTGISKSIMALIGIVLGYFLLDWIFDLPYIVRLICVALGLFSLWIVVRKHIIRELLKIRDDDEIALRIESRNPELRGRLISTLQLNRADHKGSYVGSAELLKALEGETIQMAGPLDFSRIINTSVLKKFALVALLALVIKVVLIFQFSDHFRALFGRLLSAEARFPTRTIIEEVIVPEYVARGDDVHIKVVLSLQSEAVTNPGLAQFSGIGGGRVSVEINNKVDPNVFVGILSKPTEDMTVLVKVGDTVSIPKKIRVLARPEVDAISSSLRYILPSYTKEPQLTDKFGGISVLQGSQTEINLTVSKPLVSATLQRNDGKNFELKKVSDNGLAWNLPALKIEKSGSYHLSLMDTDQLSNSQPSVEYSIDARADRQPVIKLNKPARDLTVTGLQKVKIAFSARDDYNIRAVWIAYKIQSEGGANIGATKREELPFKNSKLLEPTPFTWDLSGLNLKVGDQVVFWMEADDDCTTNNEILAPHAPSMTPKDAEPALAKMTEDKLYSYTSDVKLSVISREDKITEWETELQRLVHSVESTKTDEENIIRQTIKELEKEGGK